jgi:hypothetical protein
LNVRLDIEPPIIPKPEVVPDAPSEGPSASEPVEPEDPTEPQAPEATDPSDPIQLSTAAPVEPTVVPTKNAPTVKATDKAPPATNTDEAPTATPKTSDKTAAPKSTDEPAAPEATAIADGSDDGITADSPGGLSGDNSEDAGGFGDGPDDADCPLGTRDLFGLQRRVCSRLNRPLDWTAYDDIAQGKPDTAQNALDTAIKDNANDRTAAKYTADYMDYLPSSTKPFSDSYGRKISGNTAKDDFFKSIAGTIFTKVTTQAKQRPRKLMNELAVSEDKKILIAAYNHADNDNAKTLQWSEVAFQRYQEACTEDSEDVSKLESILRIAVGNQHTINTLEKVYESLGKEFGDDGEKVILHANAAAGSAEKAAFDAMLRTDNIRGTNWMLTDHHQALGNKKITTLTIWPDDDVTAILVSLG